MSSLWLFGKEWDYGFFKDFYDLGRFEKSLNPTFLLLIPKKGGTKDLKDFRPINLVGGLYKILSKVLANKLKVVVEKAISKYKNAFVEGRQILNTILVANGAIDSMIKNDAHGALYKLDIEKVYDHVNWNFLLVVIRKMNFGPKCIGWSKWYIYSAKFLILVNGTHFVLFQSSRDWSKRIPFHPSCLL